MRTTLKHIITQLLIALIAIQIINLSIDSVDFEPIPSSIVSLGDFNYLNSLTEYVAESILGHKDAFPEFQKESTSSKCQMSKHLSLKLSEIASFKMSVNFSRLSICYIVPLEEKYHYSYFNEINPPPPKTV